MKRIRILAVSTACGLIGLLAASLFPQDRDEIELTRAMIKTQRKEIVARQMNEYFFVLMMRSRVADAAWPRRADKDDARVGFSFPNAWTGVRRAAVAAPPTAPRYRHTR